MLRWLVTLTLLAVNLLLVLYLGRRTLLEPILLDVLESEVGSLLDAEVEVEAIDGNWITEIVLRGVAVRGHDGSVVEEVVGGEIAARIDPLRLVLGDLAGLRAARVTARSVRLRTDVAAGDEAGSEDGGGAVSIETFLPILPRGAEIEIDALSYRNGDKARAGPFSLSLEPGSGDRSAFVSHGDTDVRLRLSKDRVALMLHAPDPGQALRAAGVPAQVHGGLLSAEVSLTPSSLEARGQLEVTGCRYAGRVLQSSRVEVVLDRDRIILPWLEVVLAGVSVRGSDLAVAFPPSLESIEGGLALEVRDLTPYVDSLPDEVRQLMPVVGNVSGRLRRGRVRLDGGRLLAQGASVTVSAGELSLLEQDVGAEAVQVVVDVTRRRPLAVSGLGEVSVSGRLGVTISGSLAEPTARLSLALGAGSAPGIAWSAVEGDVALENGTLSARQVAVTDIAVDDAARAALVVVDGSFALGGAWPVGEARVVGRDVRVIEEETFGFDARVALSADGRLSLQPARLEGVLDATAEGSLPLGGVGPVDLRVTAADVSLPPLLHLSGVELTQPGVIAAELVVSGSIDAPKVSLDTRLELPQLGEDLAGRWPAALGPPPSGPVTFVLDARVDEVTTVERLELRAGEEGARVNLSAAGAVGLGLGAGFAPKRVETGALRGTLVAEGMGTDDCPLALRAGLELTDEDIELEVEELRVGPGTITGGVRLGLSALDVAFGTVADPGGAALSGAVRLASVRLEDLPPAWFKVAQEIGGSLDAVAEVSGTLRAPRPGLVAEIGEGVLKLPGAPGWSEVSARVRVDGDGLAIERFEGRVGEGRVEMAGTLATGRSPWEPGAFDPETARLDFVFNAAAFDLASLPYRPEALPVLKGILTSDVRVTGTVARPAPKGEVVLRDGTVRIAGVPRIEAVRARVVLAPDRIEVRDFDGKMGAGDVRLEAALETPAGFAPSALDVARLQATVKGHDVLLARSRGVRIRAHPDVTVEGTLADLRVGGTVTLSSSRIVRRISLIPDLGARGGEGVDEGVVLPGLPVTIGRRIHLDVAIRTADALRLRTRVIDAEIQSELQLRGTGSHPHLEGAVSAASGQIGFPGAALRLEAFVLTFSADRPTVPDILLRGSGRRHGINVDLTVKGASDDPEVILSSTPPFPPRELIVLITTGALPATLSQMSRQARATLVGSFLAEEIIDLYFGSDSTEAREGLLDRFHIEAGREISSSGDESVMFEFEVTPKFSLQAERDAYNDYNMGLVYRIRF